MGKFRPEYFYNIVSTFFPFETDTMRVNKIQCLPVTLSSCSTNYRGLTPKRRTELLVLVTLCIAYCMQQTLRLVQVLLHFVFHGIARYNTLASMVQETGTVSL